MKPFEILLVEDNPGDVELVRQVFEESKASLRVEPDGARALEYLSGLQGAPAPKPALILLDLNLPKKHGFNVLSELRALADFALTPVVVFTSSIAEADVAESYSRGANAYVNKPQDLEGFDRVMDVLRRFWTEVVQLPAT